MKRNEGLEIGVHLHSRADDAATKILAAYDAGCRRVSMRRWADWGGCPFAQDELVGNIPTERVIEALQRRKIDIGGIGELSGLLQQTLQNLQYVLRGD